MNKFALKVSVLIPIYNVQETIVECARSLFEQSYPNCEFIFVDDGSTDYSYYRLRDVIDIEYPELEDRIRIVRHLRNRGLAETRITAMECAEGEFMMFVDSDDWVDKNLVTKLVREQRREDADIVSTDYFHVFNGKRRHIHTHWIGGREGSLNIVLSQNFSLPNRIWAMLFRSDMIHRNGIRGDGSVSYGEDSLLLVKLLYYAREIAHVGQALYFYRADSPGSFTNNQTKLSARNYIRSQLLIWEFMASRDAIMKYGKALMLGRMNLRRWLVIRKGGGGVAGFCYRAWCWLINKAWSVNCWASGL